MLNFSINSKIKVPTLAGLFNLDEFEINKVIKENRLENKRQRKFKDRRGRKRLFQSHHIEFIKDFVKKHNRKYYTVTDI